MQIQILIQAHMQEADVDRYAFNPPPPVCLIYNLLDCIL